MNQSSSKVTELNFEIEKLDTHFEVDLSLVSCTDNVYTYKLKVHSDTKASPKLITVKWKIPALNVKGVWKCGEIHKKRLQYDWEREHLSSRVSVDAPVISVFGHKDENVLTFACADAINLLEMNTLLREEDNHLYSFISFFKERHEEIYEYETFIRIDLSNVRYSTSIQDVSKWWETFDYLKPTSVPDIARLPLYSTWYQFHQSLDEDILLEECKIAVGLGYKLIILDDGWQTMDTNRGYDYTGDWQPDRFPNLKEFVAKVQSIGVKFGLWFSVPFCGKKSAAYKRFKGKFLTENHRWAPVFDPRYPEVRAYLIVTYCNALTSYNLDAFKLDFIDDFKVYPETVLTKENGRDYANVNEAVDRLMTDIMHSLWKIKADIAVEFRQQYIGPAMRKFGNMFRAFDCPNDPISNRIRTTDVKLLCGNTAVHSDMITWHKDEKVELSALQVLNAFFSVPQMSVHLRNLPAAHLEMLKFYTTYWTANQKIILDSTFTPVNPLGNYSVLKVENDEKNITAIYDDVNIEYDGKSTMDVLNAKISKSVIVKNTSNIKRLSVSVYNCRGQVVDQSYLDFHTASLHEINVPIAGMCRLEKFANES